MKNINDQYVDKIVTDMEEIIWIGRNNKIALSIKMHLVFLYCPLINSKWFNVNFIRGLNEEINMLRDKYSNAGFLITGDFNCRTGEEQVKLPDHFDVWENWNAQSYNSGIKDTARTKTVERNCRRKEFYKFLCN